ncbi:MAG: type II/IV secretion system protein, partial [Planctomycetes bacterium]|nr:type II/IV secretion system protein [Planctomycetota bacterium]
MDIAQILVRHGLLDERSVSQVKNDSAGIRIDLYLVQAGLVDEFDVLKAFSDELQMPLVEVKQEKIDRDLLTRFPTAVVFRNSLLPLYQRNGQVVVATSDPLDFEALEELESVSDMPLEPVLARRSDIVELIKEHLGVGGDTLTELVAQRTADGIELLSDATSDESDLASQAENASVIKLVNELLMEALEQQASDVHIEPQENGLIIRYRVDGLLRVQPIPETITHFYSAIVTRLKIMSKLNIAEKRVPQDGRIKLKISGREIDVRVSIIPMVHGEGV